MLSTWCVVLAARASARFHLIPMVGRPASGSSASLVTSEPIRETIGRAHSFAPKERIAAVLADSFTDFSCGIDMDRLDSRNIVIEPVHRGTGYEILLALLWLETRIEPKAPVIFLPADHIVSDERLMCEALADMAGWIGKEPESVYLLGAVPEGPHNQLGYIVPWLETSLVPTGVYEFVEMPDVYAARSLINSGSLWNTFIFGGTFISIVQLFRPHYDAQVNAIREAISVEVTSSSGSGALTQVFEKLQPIDFSGDILKARIDRLNVLRLPPCGWWPLKSPALDPTPGLPSEGLPSDTHPAGQPHRSPAETSD